jgi:hypothetical protein
LSNIRAVAKLTEFIVGAVPEDIEKGRFNFFNGTMAHRI